ncbi:flavodoxin family protein [Anaerorhabdus sp.]|uniref:flavodoxin family protein n=1 Tax=Anaerorhabdus sp. TaxID=1872524 RepID=UPI002FC61ABF
MTKKVCIISTTLRKNGNSELLANEFYKGAKDAGHDVKMISLIDKTIHFCKGCLTCQNTGFCAIKDDVNAIEDVVLNSDVVVFATPIYYYEMSGQMKTLLDRMNAMFPKEYKFRDIYFLASAAEEEDTAMDYAIQGLKGWVECYEKSSLKGVVKAIGVTDIGDIKQHQHYLEESYALGKGI